MSGRQNVLTAMNALTSSAQLPAEVPVPARVAAALIAPAHFALHRIACVRVHAQVADRLSLRTPRTPPAGTGRGGWAFIETCIGEGEIDPDEMCCRASIPARPVTPKICFPINRV